ncbi:NanoRNase/pAp phosphatase [Planctomycetes bacterium Poly30]|uniref:NanoRNase/pAp phosphatase n=1 Tax=Saltatorellus ferox TaxID=2528018 RepID=A0A518EWB2_9BACT|nr:NanoRNase/pAp phosphatase [Planctomycetes bacterium Poly30]
MYEPPPVTDDQLRAVELLKSSKRILLTGHERPDGDCVGSQAALACALGAAGKSVFVMNVDAPAPVFSELTALADFRVDSGESLPEHDLVVMLDGGDLSRTGALHDRLARAPSRKLVVDHHLHDGAAWWDEAFVDTSASATGVLVRRLCAHLGAEISPGAARAIFTTLVTDTGWFKYSNTDVETLSIAAEMISLGVRPAEVYGDLFQRQPLQHPLKLAGALARTTYFADGKIVLLDLPLGPDGLAMDVDSDVALDVVRSVEAVEVALVVREIGPRRCKLSARSKGAFDVQKLAALFGGGGHVKAAGATIELNLQDARSQLVEAALVRLAETEERRSTPRTAADAARQPRP